MSKRFVDTNIWQKEWFQVLTLKEKVLVKYIYENCDCAGVWTSNFRMASFIIGETVSIEDVKAINSKKEQFEILENGKIWVKDFIKFQYGALSEKFNPHKTVINLLKEYGLLEKVINEDKTFNSEDISYECSKQDETFTTEDVEEHKNDVVVDYHGSYHGNKQDKTFNKENNKKDKNNNLVGYHGSLQEKEKEQEQYKEQDKEKEKEKEIEKVFDFKNPDLMFDKNIEKVFIEYENKCKNCLPLKFERRNLEIRASISEFLRVVNYDFGYFGELCRKADELKSIYENPIDLKALIKNHERIYSGFYIGAKNNDSKSLKAHDRPLTADDVLEKAGW